MRRLLSELRPCLDAGFADSRWVLHTDGILGRGLLSEAGERVRYPLALARPVPFDGRVLMLSHDWRDGRGALRATVSTVDAEGLERTAWTGVLRAGDRGRPRGLRVRCTLPADTTGLILSVQALGELRTGSVTRAAWLTPALYDPTAAITATQAAPSVGPTTSINGDSSPVISVLTPVHNPPLEMLQQAIASVTAQTYPHWELCLVDDGSTDSAVTAALQQHAATDPRIHLSRHPTAQGISAATNHALTLATGDYIALLDHDDTLTPDALQHVAHHIQTDPSLDMLYSDEDIVLDGRPVWVHIKPGWSPDTLRTNGYTCHLGVYRTALVREIGGFRTEFNGSQDVDMILRLTERTDRVAHVPRVLYHWRAHASSTAGGDAKPYAYVAARNAIAEHLQRIGVDADVGFGPPGLYRVSHRVPASLGVDLALALGTVDGLAPLAASLSAQPHPSWQLTIAAPRHLHEPAGEALSAAGVPPQRVAFVDADACTPVAALDRAAAAGRAPHVVLLRSPGQALTHNWLGRLLGYSQQPGIAAAGPVILAADGRIRHAGVALPAGLPLHLLHGTRSSMDHFFGYGTSVYNVLALDGALITPRAVFEATGGLDVDLNDCALIDYCLRAADHGRAVIVPDVRLRATGPDPTVNDLPALRRLHASWARHHGQDPYYNPSYRTDRGDFEVSRP